MQVSKHTPYGVFVLQEVQEQNLIFWFTVQRNSGTWYFKENTENADKSVKMWKNTEKGNGNFLGGYFL